MKSKKQNKCANCLYFNGNCTHKTNVGIKVKYRLENEFYIKTTDVLNPDGKCNNYAKA